MTKRHLSGTIALGALFSGALLYYSFFQPFIPGAVQQAVPEVASFVHRADSLEELLQCPVCTQIDQTLGAGNTLRELLTSNPWVPLAAPSEIAVLDIPLLQAGQHKSWAAISWVGWRSPWLRWKLEQAAGKNNLRFLGKHAVWPIWQYDAPDFARHMTLTFALTDNLFLACLSERPADIVWLLDAYDNYHPTATP
jgi:hypothetical protein